MHIWRLARLPMRSRSGREAFIVKCGEGHYGGGLLQDTLVSGYLTCLNFRQITVLMLRLLVAAHFGCHTEESSEYLAYMEASTAISHLVNDKFSLKSR